MCVETSVLVKAATTIWDQDVIKKSEHWDGDKTKTAYIQGKKTYKTEQKTRVFFINSSLLSNIFTSTNLLKKLKKRIKK